MKAGPQHETYSIQHKASKLLQICFMFHASGFMIYFIYLIFGTAPSIIWLLFFLRKDAHPESVRMVISVFLLGAAIIPLVFIFECLPVGADFGTGDIKCFSSLFFLGGKFPRLLGLVLQTFLVVALIEEIAKYLIVRLRVLRDPEFDEPLDIMLYMIVAALGFAALENILYLYSSGETFLRQEGATASFSTLLLIIFGTGFFRFIGATLLHALCSATIGFFIARSFCQVKYRKLLFLAGFFFAVVLHGLFNLSIINIVGYLNALVNGQTTPAYFQVFIASVFAIIVILAGLAIFVTFGFRNLKKLSSTCKIK